MQKIKVFTWKEMALLIPKLAEHKEVSIESLTEIYGYLYKYAENQKLEFVQMLLAAPNVGTVIVFREV